MIHKRTQKVPGAFFFAKSDLFGPDEKIILLMAEIRKTHQLRLVVYPIIYRVSYIPGGARFQPSPVGLYTVPEMFGIESIC